jgi:hypothetical protein
MREWLCSSKWSASRPGRFTARGSGICTFINIPSLNLVLPGSVEKDWNVLTRDTGRVQAVGPGVARKARKCLPLYREAGCDRSSLSGIDNSACGSVWV